MNAMNKYQTMDEAADANFKLIREVFHEDKFEVIEPESKFSHYDGIVKYGKLTVFVEVKIRNFTFDFLKMKYENSIMLELVKYNRLLEEKSEVEHGRALYVVGFSCGTVVIYDLDVIDPQWEHIPCNAVTYVHNTNWAQKVTKQVAMLPITQAVKVITPKF